MLAQTLDALSDLGVYQNEGFVTRPYAMRYSVRFPLEDGPWFHIWLCISLQFKLFKLAAGLQ